MNLNIKNNWCWWTILLVIVLVAYLLPLQFRPLMTPDETRYAEIPREIVSSGNWIVPHLGGLRYFEKPIMGYWLGAISQICFGENNFAVRFPSAICTILAAVMLLGLVRRYKDVETALLTAVIFLSCSLVYFIGTFAVLDAPTSMFMTGALVTFYLAAHASRKKMVVLWLILLGIFCGGAFLTKGFIALVVPALVIGPYMIWEKRWKDLLWMPWIPLLVAVLVATPWAWLIHQRDADFWHYFVIVEHWERFTKDNSSQHPAPVWYFIPIIIAGMMPWTLLLPGIIAKIKWVLPQESLTRYTWCWLILPFLFFSASSGKLGTYILPCFPAVAFLLALGIIAYFRQNDYRIFDAVCRWTAIFLMSAMVILVLSQILSIVGITQDIAAKFTPEALSDTALFRENETWKLVLCILAISSWCGTLLVAARTANVKYKIMGFCWGPVLAFTVAQPICPDVVLEKKAPGTFLMRFADKIQTDDIIVCYNNTFVPASWFYKRNNIYMYHKGGEMEYGLKKSTAQGRLISVEEFAHMVNNPQRRHRIVFLMQSKRFRDGVPPAAFEVYEREHDRIMFMIYPVPGKPAPHATP